MASDEMFQLFSWDQALFVLVSGADKYRPLLHQEKRFTFLLEMKFYFLIKDFKTYLILNIFHFIFRKILYCLIIFFDHYLLHFLRYIGLLTNETV